MIPFSLMILIAVTAAVLVRGFVQKAVYLKYPFLAAAVTAGWFIPQAIGLADDVLLPVGGYDITMIYAAMAMVACVLGERWTGKATVVKTWVYNENRLAVGAAVLSIIGAISFSLILRTDADKNADGFTTGVVTIYFFLFTLQYIGLALALLLLLRKFSWVTFGIVFFDYSYISSFVLFGGRRGAAMDVTFITLCALWFERKILIPRLMMIVGIICGALFINVAGEYRSLVATINKNATEPRLPTLQEVMDIPFFERFTETATKGSFEVKNAIYYISSALYYGNYDFGTHYWNYLIFRFIPGQLIGADLKQSLMFDLPDDPSRVFDYTRHAGTTYTGFADSFSAFSFFGVFVFAAIAALMSKWWRSAIAGDFEARLFYAASVATSMQSVTHGTEWFFVYLPQLFMFTFPFLYWAREREQNVTQMTGAMVHR